MIEQAVMSAHGEGAEAALRGALARGDAVAAGAWPILRHLVGARDDELFSEEVLTRVRGALVDLASGLLDALVGAPNHGGYGADEVDVLVQAFLEDRALLGHVHALALEWQLAESLERRLAIDPVMSPMLRTLLADHGTQALAARFVAAQARWCTAQRAMRLPLRELPAPQLESVLFTMRTLAEVEPALADRARAAEADLRGTYVEGDTRLGLAAALAGVAIDGGRLALDIAHGGAALFLTVLGGWSGQTREAAVLSTGQGQLARLALGLRAAGLDAPSVCAQVLALHPDAQAPDGIGQVDRDTARVLLAGSGLSGSGLSELGRR